MCRFFLLLAGVFLYGLSLKAQIPDTASRRNKQEALSHKRDSLTSKPFKPSAKIDRTRIDHPDSTHSPHKAVMRSLMIPGWGQIYNRHGLWWRLPLLYGGFYLLGKNIVDNGKQYNIFLTEAQWREGGRVPVGSDPHPEYAAASDAAIIDIKDISRRNRDLTIIASVAAWGVNMVDAYVEAKFMHSYSMDDNLSFKITPSLINEPVYASNFNTFTPVLKLTITF